MTCLNLWKNLILFTVLFGLATCIQANAVTDPCDSLLNLVNRPTVADSACVVPVHKVEMEFGTQYQRLYQSPNHQLNYPQSVLRFGLPKKSELVFVGPNLIKQSGEEPSGSNSPILGIKHLLFNTGNTLLSVESLFTLPAGSPALGNKDIGVSFNGIIGYSITPKLGINFMAGVSDQTQSQLDGGERTISVNPDLVLTYLLQEKLSLYGEIYGQSKTAPDQGSGFNWDVGFIYLWSPTLTVDVSAGRRLSGQLGGFSDYIGAGFAFII